MYSIIGICSLGAGLVPASAEEITWGFSGEITDVWDPDGFLGGGVTIGDPFYGTYTFESTTPDSRPDYPNYGFYEDAITALSGQAGNIGFTQGSGSAPWAITVHDGHPGSSFDAYSANALANILGEDLAFSLSLSLSLSPTKMEASSPATSSCLTHRPWIRSSSETSFSQRNSARRSRRG